MRDDPHRGSEEVGFGPGLEEAESAVSDSNTTGQLELAQQIKTLTLPTEMGERFKVIGLHRNLDIDIPAFTQER